METKHLPKIPKIFLLYFTGKSIVRLETRLQRYLVQDSTDIFLIQWRSILKASLQWKFAFRHLVRSSCVNTTEFHVLDENSCRSFVLIGEIKSEIFDRIE